MSRKDYVRLASALKSTRPIPGAIGAEQWINDVSAIARTLADDNPRFDRVKFILATEAGS